jgi:endonuclease/exonuclease/phosphatase (EEP) superfamily protein YafD
MVGASMKSILVLLRWLLRWAPVVLAAACATAALVGQAGRWSDDLDVLNHFSAFWLAGGVIALLLWFASRVGRWAPALAGLAIVIAAFQMAPELLARHGPAAPTPGAETLKIIQFNVWTQNVDQTATLRWVLAQKPDIVIVEEALGSPIIAHGLKASFRYRRTCLGLTYCETEIFSNRAPIAHGGLLGTIGIPAAWAVFDGAGGPITVLGTHAAWPVPGGPQQWQSTMLARVLENCPKDRLIVTGDFNSTPWSFSLRRQDRLFGLERRTHGQASWPARAYHVFDFDPPFPLLPIDQVYAGKGWRTLSVQRGPRLGSDHYPLIVTLQATTPAARAR